MEFINNYSKTVGLWFGNFEFNASIYYIAREIGYTITGYNEIAIIGKVLPMISLLIILGLSFLKQNTTLPKLTTSILLAFTCYLFLSTTVHPWYSNTCYTMCIYRLSIPISLESCDDFKLFILYRNRKFT